jgi:hypothetical protein
MPTLLELQHAMRRSLIRRDDQGIAAVLANDVAMDRLDIYRNTIIFGLTKALRLSYPVVERLVGDEFFEAAAELFIEEQPPRAAYLDQYGSEFSEFLGRLPSAASLVYLADVASFEWAVSCALHAPDAESLELARLAAIAPDDQGRVRLVAHPSVRLLRADYPVDLIWRAVLSGDDETLGAIDINTGPVHLLIERGTTGINVVRFNQSEWCFVATLCAGRPLQSVLGSSFDVDAPAVLAEHLAAGRFVSFEFAAQGLMTSSPATVA